ncbi:MAG TPA: Fe-S cluster assembly protein SufD [Verrucomicrobiae bacterium]|nr:Fe-S cluster assembly protein SufD [Verrucomicrobiae bacterium]
MRPATPRRPGKAAEPFLEKFRGLESELSQPSWLWPLRKAGIERFAELGFPTLHDEDWRFTNVAPLARLPFKPVFKPSRTDVTFDDLNRFAFSVINRRRLVFVDGHYCQGFTPDRPEKENPELHIGSLRQTLSGGTAEKFLTHYAKADDNPFAALNQAFFHDGAFIHIPAGQVVPEPVHLLFVSTSREAGTAVHPRNLIIAGANSQATIIESYVTLGGAAYFTNAVTEIIAGDNVMLEHVKFQDEAADAFHLATIAGEFGRASNVRLHSFALGARLSRNNIRTKLAGEGLECILNGLYLTRGEQLADHYMVVEHAQPHCASHEYFNGILDDKSRGVFHGRIYVHPVAQKTDAKQTNKNLLLSDDATADTKPQLEIYADDVKCTHGATVGQLNEESIFYLRSRGIPENTARRMLIHAFAGEIIERVNCGPVREELDKIVWDRLEANLHLANGKK